MQIAAIAAQLSCAGISFFTGVPDSQLGPFCDWLAATHGTGGASHIVAQNEGGAVGLAAGYHLATGKVPCIYMQNSGIGNAVNPITSLTSPEVYGIPVLYVIGWRGEPGVKDEPQHLFQGKITEKLLADLDIATFILDKETTETTLCEVLGTFAALFAKGKSAALLVKKDALENPHKHRYTNSYTLGRETAVQAVAKAAGDGIIVSTTGKISRELFEYREKAGHGHANDFLTVGSMGHSLMIALGIAINKPGQRVWCLDGDGAVLMHMGALAIVGSKKPQNLIHVVLNNTAHETVGGMPTAAAEIDLPAMAQACGYAAAFSANDDKTMGDAFVATVSTDGPVFIEIKVALGARADLGRPTTTPQQNKQALMEPLAEMQGGGLAD